jgi:diketogulonate reductase-like aldo/keto reductase
MEALVDAGLVKSIGVSNFGLAQVEQLLASCRIRPSVNQVELHVLNAQRKLVGVLFRKVGIPPP